MSQLNKNTRACIMGYIPDMIGDFNWIVGSRKDHRLAAYRTKEEALIFIDGYNRRLAGLAERDPAATRETAVKALCDLIEAVFKAIPGVGRCKKYAELDKAMRKAEKEALRW